MDSRFWVFCWKYGNAKVKEYVWSRQDIPLEERSQQDERFFKGGLGKRMRARFWQHGITSNDDSDDDDPRDEVELLAMCVRDTEREICAAPDSVLLKRARHGYIQRLKKARDERLKLRRLNQRNMLNAMTHAVLLERFTESAKLNGDDTPGIVSKDKADQTSSDQKPSL